MLIRFCIVATGCALSISHAAHAAPCDLVVPYPPDPVPPGYNWTPLAQQWCSQLAGCVPPDPECVANYLYAISSFPVPPGSGSEGTDAQSTVDFLVCEDSEQYAAGTYDCSALTCLPDAGVPDGGGFPDASVADAHIADGGGTGSDGGGTGSDGGGTGSDGGGTGSDASMADARVLDGSMPDSRMPDSGMPDSGVFDAGSGSDASVFDAGIHDAMIMSDAITIGRADRTRRLHPARSSMNHAD